MSNDEREKFSGRMSRREALALLGASALMPLPAAAAQPAPRRGGILRVSAPSNPSSLDPATGASGFDHAFLWTMFDTLLEFEPDSLVPKPGLADWKTGNDGKSILLDIKPGILFHDGTPCDAQAVRFNLERYRSDPRSNVKSEMTSISAVEVTGPLQVRLVLRNPDATVPAMLADRQGMMCSPKALSEAGNESARKPVGAGPWRFVEWADNQQVVVTRNEKYWRPGRPYLDGITFSIIPELSTGLRSVLAKQNHMVVGLNPRLMPLVQRAKDVQLLQQPTLTQQIIYLNTSRAPLDNLKVRQAMNFAIDRDAYLKATLAGVGEAATQNLPSSHWAYNKSLEGMYPHDPAHAKKLLSEAGFPSGVEMTIGAWNDQDSMRRREIVEAQLGAVGIRCKFTAGTTADTTRQFFGAEKKFDAFLSSSGSRPDPSQIIFNLFDKGSYFNASRTESAELSELMFQAKSQEAMAARGSAIAAVMRYAMQQALTVPLVFQSEVDALSAQVNGFKPNLMGRQIYSGVWLQA